MSANRDPHARLVLASNSQSRMAMLEAAGVCFESEAAAIDERALEAELGEAKPEEIARTLGRAKASDVSRRRPSALVLGSDSLVVVGARRFDKPASREEAADHLRYFSGRVMELHSAAAIARDGQCLWDRARCARLKWRELSESFIADYLEHEWPQVGQCVGVFRIEGRGVQLFEHIEGDHFTVLGMPLLDVLAALRRFGVLEQ